MFDNLVRVYVAVGLIVFGLRAVFYELGIAPWLVMLSLAVALIVWVSVRHGRDAVNGLQTRIGVYPVRRRAV